MTLTKKLFIINNYQKSWSCYQDFFLLLVLFIYVKKLYNSTNTQFLENFERGFIWDTQLLLSVLQVPLVLK